MTTGVQRRGSLLLEGKNQGKDRKMESKKDEKGIKLMGYERLYFHFNVYIKIDVVLLVFICLFVIWVVHGAGNFTVFSFYLDDSEK